MFALLELMIKFLTYIPFVLSLLSATVTHAKSGVEAAQLDYVALDASVECNRILFQSSQHFKQTLFVIPRVVVGNGINGSRTYNITPTNRPGIYNLAINLYFPSNDESLKTNVASLTKKDLQACNWDKVKYSLNKNIQDPQLKITTISRIPLTSIEVKIQGIHETGSVGRTVATNEEADILDYYGKSLTVYFKINEDEKKIFQSQLVSPEGISASVKYRFQARSRNGSVHAKIDLQNLAQNFSAAASAKGLKFIASGDISATLKSSVSSNSVQITSESGSTDETSKVTQMLLEKILSEINVSLPKNEILSSNKAKAGSGQFSVAAVVEILKTKVSSEITFNMVAAPEVATAQSEINLRTDSLNDPNIIPIPMTAGILDPSAGISVKKGQTIMITPAYWFIDKIKYNDVTSYLTMSDIENLKISSNFETLVDQNMKITNVEVNGTLFAEGKWIPFNWRDPIATPNRFRWKRLTKEADPVRDSSNVISPKIESLNALPIYVTFSDLGDRQFIKLSDLFLENPFWVAVHDKNTGRIVLTASQDLGTLRFRNRMRSKAEIEYSDKTIILDQIVEQKTNIFGKKIDTQIQVIKQDQKPIVLQKTIVVNVTRPKVLSASEKQYFKTIQVESKSISPITSEFLN